MEEWHLRFYALGPLFAQFSVLIASCRLQFSCQMYVRVDSAGLRWETNRDLRTALKPYLNQELMAFLHVTCINCEFSKWWVCHLT
jgi:hypothetical protein